MSKSLSFITLLVLMLLVSCKPGVPNKYIQPGKMEDILYDYHLAEGLTARSNSLNDSATNLTLRAYQLAILEKYKVSEAQFDSSMVYYMRHTERFHTIYENLETRMNKELVALGGAGKDMYDDNLSANGDTVNIWTEERSFVFTPTIPFNQKSFYIKADTTFHKGDVLSLNLDAQFIYQDGTRNGNVMLAVRFANDSVAYQMTHISSSSKYTLQVRDYKRLGIKEIRGFFFLSNSAYMQQSSTTLQILFIQNVRLIRMHEQERSINNAIRKDSIRIDTTQSIQPQNVPTPRVSTPVGVDKNTNISTPVRRPIRRIAPINNAIRRENDFSPIQHRPIRRIEPIKNN